MAWSLYRKKEDENLVGGIFDYASESLDGDVLSPLRFSNNKTQEDVVAEVLDAIEKGNK